MIIQRKRVAKRLASGLLAGALAFGGLAISGASSAGAAVAVTVTRTGLTASDSIYSTNLASIGADRTDLILVSGTKFADGLSAAPLSVQEDADIMLVPPTGLSADHIAKVIAENPTKVWIIGGSAAVPFSVEAQLTALTAAGGAGLSASIIERVGGANRYQTSAMVAAKISTIPNYNLKKTAIVVRGDNFADAVIAGPAANGIAGASGAHPIYLAFGDTLDESVRISMVNSAIAQAIIVGGTSAVSSSVENAIKALGATTVRISGASRFDTASAMASHLTKSIVDGGFGYSAASPAVADLTNEGAGMDGLSAFNVVGEGPILGMSSSVPTATCTWLTGKAGTVSTLNVVGGISVISADAANAAKVCAGASLDTPTATIAAAEGALKYTVTFSEAMKTSTGVDADFRTILAVDGTSVNGTVAWNAAGTVATVTNSAALAKGDTIRIPALSIETADGRKIGLTDFVVPADTTVPTAAITALDGATNTITLEFSEPVVSADGGGLAGADFNLGMTTTPTAVTVGSIATYLGGVAGTTTATDTDVRANAFDKIVVTITDAPTASQAIGLIKDKFVDLAGNKVAAVQTTFSADSTAPTVTGNPTYAYAATSAAQVVVGGVTGGKVLVVFNSKGYAGNAWDVDTAALSVDTTSNTLSVTLDAANTDIDVVLAENASDASTSTAADLAAAINTAAGAYVTATVLEAGVVGDDAAGQNNSLAGGVTTLTVTSTFSEAVTAAKADVDYDGDDDGTGVDAATITVTGNVVVTTYSLSSGSADGAIPTLGTSEINYATAITDLAGNAMSAASKDLAV